eukprot:13319291-Alexandrium_andersonii.AAC.1
MEDPKALIGLDKGRQRGNVEVPGAVLTLHLCRRLLAHHAHACLHLGLPTHQRCVIVLRERVPGELVLVIAVPPALPRENSRRARALA